MLSQFTAEEYNMAGKTMDVRYVCYEVNTFLVIFLFYYYYFFTI